MVHRSVVLGVAGLLLVTVLPGFPLAEAHHHALLQPGARMTGPAGCTFNFVYEDTTGRLYIGTAGHCVGGVGQRVSAEGLGPMGTVVYDGPLSIDCAIVRIDADKLGLVNPAMRHWGGPLGIAEPTGVPQVVVAYGYGALYQGSELTRPRAGEATQITTTEYLIEIPVWFGDSGGPYMSADGKAVGIVSRLAAESLHTVRGATVAWCLQNANAATGLGLTIVTAPLSDPVERSVQQLEHETGEDLP